MNDGDLARVARARADVLEAYAHTLRSLPSTAHASWRNEKFPDFAVHTAALSGDAFAEPVNRLAVLPPEPCDRLLRLRALVHRRAQLRKSLAPSTRKLGIEWVGKVAWHSLLLDAPEATESHGLPLGDAPATASALAWEGYCRMQQDQAWAEPALERMVRLRFARDAIALRASPMSQATDWVLTHMTEFVPEVAWLSG